MNHSYIDYIIVGQGIGGILLAYELINRGAYCLVIDDEDASSASRNAGALLNPVNLNTAKAFPRQEAELKIAIHTYRILETLLSVSFLKQLPLFVFPELSKRPEYLFHPLFHTPTIEQQDFLSNIFFHPENAFVLPKVYKINFDKLKEGWKAYLVANYLFLKEKFDYSLCRFENNKVGYKNFEAKKIVFCEGAKGNNNPFFPQLPFTANLGNILQLQIERLSENYAYHFQGKKLLPLGADQFWFGSNYQWNFKNMEPDKTWREDSASFLKKWLKVSYTIQRHLTAQRPTTAGQRPLLLRHSSLPAYLFNGLGTRGFSRGPTLAKEMSRLCTGT